MEERISREFIGYEYKEVVGESSRLPILMDGYESFGWEVTEQSVLLQQKYADKGHQPGKERLMLRRNRHIANKVELTRLQRNFEACVDEIRKLEDNKTTKAMMIAITIGVIGCAFMAGAVLAATAPEANYVLMVLLAIPGFVGWTVPLPIYRRIVQKETKRLDPVIDRKYEEIYELMERGYKLTR